MTDGTTVVVSKIIALRGVSVQDKVTRKQEKPCILAVHSLCVKKKRNATKILTGKFTA